MHRKWLPLIAVGVTAFAVLVVPGSAGANPGPQPVAPASDQHRAQTPRPGEYPSSAPLNGRSTGGSAITPNLAPSGCYGQTDRPHLSTHVPGSVNVVARTVCYGYLDYVTTDLYRSRWYGWEWRASGNMTAYNNAQANAAESAADCDGTHDYLAQSYHENLDNGSYAYTQNSAAALTC
jgi:hypothetical protein